MRDSTKNQIKVVLIRHGATGSNLEKRYCGRGSDEKLTPEGMEIIKKKLIAGRYPTTDVVYCSPKKRTLQTAKIICPNLNPVVIEELDEIDFGAFEGRNYEELKDVPEYQQWIDSGGESRFPGGESRAEYCERVKAGFLKALEDTMQRGFESMGIVAHGGTIMALLSIYGGMNYYDGMVGNAEGFLCEFSPNTRHLKIVRKIE